MHLNVLYENIFLVPEFIAHVNAVNAFNDTLLKKKKEILEVTWTLIKVQEQRKVFKLRNIKT